MKAINSYVLVEKIKLPPKKTSGLILNENTDLDNRYSKGTIISAGNLVEGVVDGDVVFYDKHAGHSVTDEGKLYQVITVRDIVLVE